MPYGQVRNVEHPAAVIVDGNILKIRPPMVLKREHADILIKAFGEALN